MITTSINRGAEARRLAELPGAVRTSLYLQLSQFVSQASYIESMEALALAPWLPYEGQEDGGKVVVMECAQVVALPTMRSRAAIG